jgi:hypothetical protein
MQQQNAKLGATLPSNCRGSKLAWDWPVVVKFMGEPPHEHCRFYHHSLCADNFIFIESKVNFRNEPPKMHQPPGVNERLDFTRAAAA